ncbi:transmembrane sensor [Paucibacter oligotrophus]|uniref:Transmembrane sensor n=1 Tax=Roseateles oligotrophus TaxID=1769250 RepID=A0A840LBF3_9BURK|nr:FecR domain-containing protein [Roseateles oligotrophus]MBB4845924.1 transmembrane sensor [Roseateles oligotrophus]
MSAEPDARPLDRAVARAAAQWLMRLHGGELSGAELQACERWRAADPEHERAWQRAQALAQRLGQLPRGPALAALNRPRGAGRPGRRQALGGLVALLAGAPAAWLLWPETSGEYSSAIGQRRELRLPDGSQLHLNTDTAITLHFGASERRIALRRGEIRVDTAADPGLQRPFLVDTAQGRLRALGTRFLVRELSGAQTLLLVEQGAVEISPSQGAVRVLQAGQQSVFSNDGAQAPQPAAAQAAAWTRGLLFAHEMRLDEFAAELSRHRPGLLRCEPAVAGLRISGAFQLDRIDAVLDALPLTLPLRVVRRTRWWVTLAAR